MRGKTIGVNAYFTVEAALVLPVVMCVILFLIYLAFFQYDRCLMEQDAASLLVKGGSLCVEDGEVLQYLEYYAENIYRDKYIAWDMNTPSIRLEGRKLGVEQRGSLEFPFVKIEDWEIDKQWEAAVSYEHKRLEPMDFVRTYRKIKKYGGW